MVDLQLYYLRLVPPSIIISQSGYTSKHYIPVFITPPTMVSSIFYPSNHHNLGLLHVQSLYASMVTSNYYIMVWFPINHAILVRLRLKLLYL